MSLSLSAHGFGELVGVREAMRTYRAVALPVSAIAEAIAYAVSQPSQVNVNEIVVHPAASAQ
ncbi:oxidoreductase, short chain dehydrogenase/reductase family protein [Streptomyces ipomoeae 91-03]|uniref:Oxidoreductase, short chain dehydrogenase/reductase family protein n=1 Tax=Streptomyces ipomoeae 91-03 TaxID=698759 RepID=L1KVJ1_9ACTN|nr:oxidoreductase, short chain dehydrogenase/reductase family protein [Streptomyces ipomoeae 91-03]